MLSQRWRRLTAIQTIPFSLDVLQLTHWTFFVIYYLFHKFSNFVVLNGNSICLFFDQIKTTCNSPHKEHNVYWFCKYKILHFQPHGAYVIKSYLYYVRYRLLNLNIKLQAINFLRPRQIQRAFHCPQALIVNVADCFLLFYFCCCPCRNHNAEDLIFFDDFDEAISYNLSKQYLQFAFLNSA